MAKAIQCDVCGQVAAQNHATGWRTLTLQSRGFITGDGTSPEFDPRADLCSAECAREWFEKVAPTCFRHVESEPPLAERSVGQDLA
jgi:hypothetical protein